MWRKLKKGFQDSRMKPVSLCNMKVTPTMEMKSLESELLHLKDYNWILFTSQNGVKLFFEKMAEKEIDVRNLGQVSFAALGSGTATMLMKYGIRADFIPSKYQVAVMAKELAEIISPGQKVLVPRALNGSRELNRIFDENHIYYKDIPMYDVTGHLTGNIRYLDELDYLVFVSASGVSAFFQGLREEKRQLPDGIKLVCIGNITRERLLQEYGDAHIVAAVNDTAGLIAAIKNNQRLSEIGN
jgi:uroporphyrinogen III methyltransferase/synthase